MWWEFFTFFLSLHNVLFYIMHCYVAVQGEGAYYFLWQTFKIAVNWNTMMTNSVLDDAKYIYNMQYNFYVFKGEKYVLQYVGTVLAHMGCQDCCFSVCSPEFQHNGVISQPNTISLLSNSSFLGKDHMVAPAVHVQISCLLMDLSLFSNAEVCFTPSSPVVRSLPSRQMFEHVLRRHDVLFVYVGGVSPLKVSHRSGF